MKFQLSNTLIYKLCLIQHIFRKNGLPDDVFWHVINPLLKTDMNDVCVWSDGNFTSMLEYGECFDVVLKNKFDVFGNNFIRFTKKRMFIKDAYKKFHMSSTYDDINKIMTCHTCTYKHNNLQLHTLFSFDENNVNAYLCYVKFDDEKCDIDFKGVLCILKNEALKIVDDFKNRFLHPVYENCYGVELIQKHFNTLKLFNNV